MRTFSILWKYMMTFLLYDLQYGGRYEADHVREDGWDSFHWPPNSIYSDRNGIFQEIKENKEKESVNAQKKAKFLKADDLLETISDDEVKREIDPEDVEVKMDLYYSDPRIGSHSEDSIGQYGYMDDDDGDNFGPDTWQDWLSKKTRLSWNWSWHSTKHAKSSPRRRPAFMSTKLETEETLQAEAWPYKELKLFRVWDHSHRFDELYVRILSISRRYSDLSENREEGEEDTEFEQTRKVTDPDDDEQGAGWQSVEIDTRPVDIKTDEKPVLDEEPSLHPG